MQRILKPRVFIGSASESLAIAKQLEARLHTVAEVVIWEPMKTRIGESCLDILINTVDTVDFAIFIFSGDDKVTSRGVDFDAPRDNIIFELGLFMSKLGKHRTYIINNLDNLKIPSDLAGITYGFVQSERSDNNLAYAISPVCTALEEQFKHHGIREERIPFAHRENQSIRIEEDIAKSQQEIFRKIGIHQLDYSLQAGYSIKNCLDNTINSLSFLGVGGKKWVQEKQSFDDLIMRLLLKRQGNQIRFLLLNPDCTDAIAFNEGRNCSHKQFTDDTNKTIEFINDVKNRSRLDIQLRLYSRMPNLRITIIDQALVVLGTYCLLSTDGLDSPQMILKSSSNWAFTHNLISYFEQLWAESLVSV